MSKLFGKILHPLPNNVAKRVAYGVAGITVVLCVGGYFYVWQQIPAILRGEAPEWLAALVDYFYPRLKVERHRFDEAFFIEKARQLGIRMVLVMVLLSVFFYRFDSLQPCWERFWHRKIAVRTVGWLISTYYVGMLYYMHEWWYDFAYFPRYESFYRPISFLSLLDVPFPPVWLNWTMYGWLMISTVACIFRLKLFFFSVNVAIIFLVAHAYYFSFEKIDHGFATFGYVAMLMPFLIKSYQDARRSHNDYLDGWALWLMQSAIAFSYFLSGVEKILMGGTAWFFEHHLSAYLAASPTLSAKILLQYPLLVQAISIFILCFQLTFPIILVYPRITWLYLLSGIFFHVQTKLVMDIGTWISPWIWVYVCFIFPLWQKKKYITTKDLWKSF